MMGNHPEQAAPGFWGLPQLLGNPAPLRQTPAAVLSGPMVLRLPPLKVMSAMLVRSVQLKAPNCVKVALLMLVSSSTGGDPVITAAPWVVTSLASSVRMPGLSSKGSRHTGPQPPGTSSSPCTSAVPLRLVGPRVVSAACGSISADMRRTVTPTRREAPESTAPPLVTVASTSTKYRRSVILVMRAVTWPRPE